MKKITALIAAAAMLASQITASASQASEYKSISTVAAEKGTTITVSIAAQLDNLEGVHLSFDFDRNKLEYVSQETFIGHGDAHLNEDTLEWSTLMQAGGVAVSRSKPIATLTFRVLESIGEKEELFKLGVAEAYDKEENDVDFFKAGTLVVSSGASGIIGDVNGDTSVDASDALTILRSSAGLEDLDGSVKFLADANGDGIVDSSDALSVLRKSTGMTADERIGAAAGQSSSKLISLAS